MTLDQYQLSTNKQSSEYNPKKRGMTNLTLCAFTRSYGSSTILSINILAVFALLSKPAPGSHEGTKRTDLG